VKELIEKELAKEAQPKLKKLVLAECLQHLILQSIYRHGYFDNLVFTGGTALRLLHQTGRFSEDLDFSLGNKSRFDFSEFLEKLQKDLTLQQLPFDFSPAEKRNVAKADFRFAGILKEFKLSPLKDQKLTVKLEIDTKPPQGGTTEIGFVAVPVSYSVAVYGLSSLFATKLHAVFFRQYVKGRDFYDLQWYLARKIRPNFQLFNNAILQTEGEGHEIPESNFKKELIRRLESVDFHKVRSELERFVINPAELEFLTAQAIASLLRNYD